jgi:hypothetical protein
MHRRYPLFRVLAGGLLTANLIVSAPALAAAAPPAQVHVYVNLAPPRAIVERRPVSPGPGYVWVAGYHRWDGRAYEWVPGRWERAPRRGARWVAPQWRHDRRQGWYFVEGRWR